MRTRKEIISLTKDFFHHSSFDVRKSANQIMAEMPDYELYLKNKDKVRIKLIKENPPEWLLASYAEPLLTREQEFHMFRKYSYQRYKAHTYALHYKKRQANDWMTQSEITRNLLLCCNTRLAAYIVNKYLPEEFEKEREDLIGWCHIQLINIINKFDWNRGNKFSTYATWGIKHLIWKYFDEEKKKRSGREFQADPFQDEDDQEVTVLDLKETGDSGREREFHQGKVIELAHKLLGLIDEREREIIKKRLGINGYEEPMTLIEISKGEGVSKERVRQLEALGMIRIKNRTKTQYEELIPEILEVLGE